MPLKKSAHIEMSRWGRDHWSLLLFIETICVDHAGVIGYGDGRGFAAMRNDVTRHPHRGGDPYRGPHKPAPTYLANGEEVANHDDWDCLDDLEAAGLLENVGTGVNPVIKLTDAGWTEAHRLRRARAERNLGK
jgi:hypothetical protein